MEGVFGVISPFLTAIAIILIVFLSKVARDRSRNQVIIRAIEHGREISPELLADAKSAKKYDPLTASLVTIGVGVGIFVALYLFFEELKFAAFGFIPLFIGLGQLAAYLINKNKKES
jgi:hypothetical protein